MQLYYLLVVVLSDVVFMSSTVVNNYNIRTALFWTEPTKLIPNWNRVFFKPNRNRTKIKNLFRTSLTVSSVKITAGP